MLFNSPIFLFLYLPIVLLINRLLNIKWSNSFLLLSSLVFYFYGEVEWLAILIISILWNYFFGILIEKARNIKRKLLLSSNIIGNLLLLVYFKYALFFSNNLNLSSDWTVHFEKLILPLGISFFTFQGISYIIDVYRGEVKADKNPINIALYISYFPQLIAGPILKYKQISQYFVARKSTSQDLAIGMNRFIRGLAKKVILADNFSLIADDIFLQNPLELSTPIAWLGVLAYTLQIYFDFSAYSDMAIALGRMMGFRIPENFNYPYVASSIRDFWRRWHISLSSWFRDYLYISLGGNRKSNLRTLLNLLIVFFVTGLWHGASWNFIVWGLIHGSFLIVERLINSTSSKVWLGRIYAILVVSLSWVIFRCPDLETTLNYYYRLLNYTNDGYKESLLFLNPYFIFLFVVGIILATPLRHQIKWSSILRSPQLIQITKTFTLALLLIYCISELVSSNHHPFIYFKF